MVLRLRFGKGEILVRPEEGFLEGVLLGDGFYLEKASPGLREHVRLLPGVEP